MPSQPPSSSADTTKSEDPDIAVYTVTAIDIDTKLAAMCGIPESKVFFKFDTATVRPEAKETLDEIATCALNGPAKGKGLRVVGRTDPRGSEAYNKDLGAERAEAVAKYLREQGVPDPRIETVSKGEAAADPADPSGWPYDRRVTVRLDPGA